MIQTLASGLAGQLTDRFVMHACIGDMVRLTKGALWCEPRSVVDFWRNWPKCEPRWYYGCSLGSEPPEAGVLKQGAVLIVTKTVWTGSDLYLLVAQPLDLIDLGWFQDYNFQLI